MDRARTAASGQDEVACHVGPQPQEQLDRPPPFCGGQRLDGVGTLALGLVRGLVTSRGRPARSASGTAATPRRRAGRAGAPAGSRRAQGSTKREGPREGGAGSRQSRRGPHVGQVEGDARELGPDQDGLGRPGVGEREPGSATGQPPEAGRGRWIGEAMVRDDGLDIARADQPETDPEAARADRRQEAVLLVGAQHDGHARWRFLERLEEGRLGVLVHPLGALDDRHPGTPLGGHERQLGGEVADATVAWRRVHRSPLGGQARPAPVGGGPGGHRRRPSDRPGTPGRADRRWAAVHSRPAARSSASVVFPTPSGPTSRTACGARPPIMVATARTAAGCPRVRARSMIGRSGGLGRGRRLPWTPSLGGRGGRAIAVVDRRCLRRRGLARRAGLGSGGPGRGSIRGSRVRRGRRLARSPEASPAPWPSSTWQPPACGSPGSWWPSASPRPSPRRHRPPRRRRWPGSPPGPGVRAQPSGPPAPEASPRARAGRRSTARWSCVRPAPRPVGRHARGRDHLAGAGACCVRPLTSG